MDKIWSSSTLMFRSLPNLHFVLASIWQWSAQQSARYSWLQRVLKLLVELFNFVAYRCKSSTIYGNSSCAMRLSVAKPLSMLSCFFRFSYVSDHLLLCISVMNPLCCWEILNQIRIQRIKFFGFLINADASCFRRSLYLAFFESLFHLKFYCIFVHILWNQLFQNAPYFLLNSCSLCVSERIQFI